MPNYLKNFLHEHKHSGGIKLQNFDLILNLKPIFKAGVIILS